MKTTIVIAMALCATSASAQIVPLRAFPFDVDERSGDRLDLTPRYDDFEDLANLGRVDLAAVELPDGRTVDLELTQVDLESRNIAAQVDGVPAPRAISELGLSVWTGRVRGEPNSDVALALSRWGSRGWISSGGEIVHLMAEANAPELGGWSKSRAYFTTESSLNRAGRALGEFCKLDELTVGPHTYAPPSAPKYVPTSLFEAKIAIETDYQLFQVFGDLNAEMTYVATLMSWVSYRYEEQISVRLTFPYMQFYTTANDPWVTQEQGGGAGGLLGEFQAAWQWAVPGGAHVAHFLSGANLGGGVAWLPGLCNQPWNFSVAGNIYGGVSFPPTVNPGTWDYMVSAHELGHNFGAPHTHDYCPPADQCAPNGYFGGCQTAQVCTSSGTIMSYCHLCGGGMVNINNYFHSLSVADIRNWVVAAGCLPVAGSDTITYCNAKVNSLGCTPDIVAYGHPTLSGPDNFTLGVLNVLNNKNGLFFWGTLPDQKPFQGGELCVMPPIIRTPVEFSAGSAPPTSDCSGELYYHWSHTDLAAIGAGNTLFGQFWYRDPASQGTIGLSSGVQWTIQN
ncbi:MAG: hypothetical protein HZA52_13815 [Planctomycetes bacterium]|nr:hypothetical protein [Planctomycetota bacterium]